MRAPWRRRVPIDSGAAASREDVEYAYRLFLNRAPTEADWAVWGPPVDRGELTLRGLTDGFLLADETERRRREASVRSPQRIALAEFAIFVNREDPSIGSVIAREHAYEPHVAAALRRWLRPGDTFVDVGANVGYFTMLGAVLVGPRGRVVAVEPRRENCALIERSVAENRLENVELLRAAAGACRSTEILHVLPGATNGIIPSAPDPTVPENAERESVDVFPLDELLGDSIGVRAIKMDIEGFEPQAWAGMQATLSRDRPTVFCDLSPIALRVASRTTAEAFLAEIEACGYEVRVLRRADVEAGTVTPRDEILKALRVLGEQGLTHLDIVAVAK